MLERQPGRPDEMLFIGAAHRFLRNEYTGEAIVSTNPFMAKACTVYPGKNLDEYIISKEWAADGLKGEYESMADFALRQLRVYEQNSH